MIAIRVLFHLFQRLTRALRKDLIHLFLNFKNVFRMDDDIARLSLRTAQRLMDHDLCIGQRAAHTLRTRRQQERAH